jgi:hypothetical protein
MNEWVVIRSLRNSWSSSQMWRRIANQPVTNEMQYSPSEKLTDFQIVTEVAIFCGIRSWFPCSEQPNKPDKASPHLPSLFLWRSNFNIAQSNFSSELFRLGYVLWICRLWYVCYTLRPLHPTGLFIIIQFMKITSYEDLHYTVFLSAPCYCLLILFSSPLLLCEKQTFILIQNKR